MNRILIRNNKQYLVVGTYVIEISNLKEESNDYYLPGSTEHFLYSSDTYSNHAESNHTESNQADPTLSDANEWDFKYIIGPEEFFQEPKDNPIAEFREGQSPYIIYKLTSGDYLWIRKDKYDLIQLVYKISHDWSTWNLIIDNSGSLGEKSFGELAYIFSYSILKKGGIMFHGVVMEWNGIGVLICAHSKVGKTTHTRMWRDHEEAVILNGDRALCCKDGTSWFAYGAPWSGSSGEYRNQKTKLQAIVILEQSETNSISVLPPLKGALELIQLTFAPSWEEDLMNGSLDAIDDIVQNTLVLKLGCRPELDAVRVLKAGLEELLLTT